MTRSGFFANRSYHLPVRDTVVNMTAFAVAAVAALVAHLGAFPAQAQTIRVAQNIRVAQAPQPRPVQIVSDSIVRDSRYPSYWWAPAPREGAPDWEILPQEAGP